MTDNLTPEQRARALELVNAYLTAGGRDLRTYLFDSEVRDMLAVEAHVLASHTCTPTWRPTTADEIQPGWEVRARDVARWGVAYERIGGDWYTDTGWCIADSSWTMETTAPLPEPEPWPDEAVDVVLDELPDSNDPLGMAHALLDALAARYPGVRAAITGGEQA